MEIDIWDDLEIKIIGLIFLKVKVCMLLFESFFGGVMLIWEFVIK